MSDNRIGSACWYLPKKSASKDAVWQLGYLRQWSTDFIEFENGPGLYPVGVIEDDKTKCCHSIIVEDICFASIPPIAHRGK